MLASLPIVLPIFALILAGFVAGKTGALGPAATREVNRLVVYLALPALLFDIMATARIEDIWDPGFIIAFSAGAGIIFALTVWLRLAQRRPLADAAIDGLNAAYPNTGFIGFPLVLAVVGQSGMGQTLVAAILTVCVLFGVAMVLIELGVNRGGSRIEIAKRTLKSLATNPLLIAPVLGAIVMAFGWTLPAPVESFLDLLGGAASPCALIALGLFLANTPTGERAGHGGTTGLLIALKLLAQPLVTWVVAGPMLGLPVFSVHVAVLLAALPTGTGSFMLAEFYGREATVTSRVVLLTTILSTLTVSAYVALGM
jgi:malonate transporter and related proteins